MIEFANLPDAEREVYFQETAERSRLPAHLVEKDFWVCYTLRLLFSDAEIARYLTFKGGTSLSKVYKAIDRFSEDIDFAVSRESLGFTAAAAPDAVTFDIARFEGTHQLIVIVLLSTHEFEPAFPSLNRTGLELRKSLLIIALRISGKESIVTKRVALGELASKYEL